MLQNLLSSSASLAAFLDVDGTLIDIATTPTSVVVPPYLPELLYNVWLRLDGALALVSGRSLDDIDRLFTPYRFPAAGVHGCEIREPNGCVVGPDFDRSAVSRLHEALALYDFDSPGVLVEYKPFGAAIHYRMSPQSEAQVAACAQQLAHEFAPAFHLQRGKCVFELRPAGFSKGSAIRKLMERWPFTGRHALFIGDDLTDETGFEAVNLLGGTSVRVGPASKESLAKTSLPSPADVHVLLSSLLTKLDR